VEAGRDVDELKMSYAMRQWWLENKTALQEGRYGDVKPGSKVGADFKRPSTEAELTTEPISSPSTEDRTPATERTPSATVPGNHKSSAIVPIVGVFAALTVVIGLVFLRRKQES
jgi:hypothetical protein